MLAIDPKYVKMELYQERGDQDLSSTLTCCGMNQVNFRGIAMTVPRQFGQFGPAGGMGWTTRKRRRWNGGMRCWRNRQLYLGLYPGIYDRKPSCAAADGDDWRQTFEIKVEE